MAVKKMKVLIVDDQEIIAQDLIMNVNQMGYSGFSVSSGKEAIRRISNNFIPDLILMDVSLKDHENGIQTARVIQKLNKIPVLFVTAMPRSAVLNEIKDLFLTGYIQKPYCYEDLQVCIRELLSMRPAPGDMLGSWELFADIPDRSPARDGQSLRVARAHKQQDGGLSFMKGDPLLRGLDRDPRWPDFLKKMRLPLD